MDTGENGNVGLGSSFTLFLLQWLVMVMFATLRDGVMEYLWQFGDATSLNR
jgi:hypothetical protein